MITPLEVATLDSAARKRYMREQYEEMITNRVTDPAAWQDIHRLAPNEVRYALQFAAVKVGWQPVMELLIAMTQSPAMLFVNLPGFVDFNEVQQLAVFTDPASVAEFCLRFPEWTVMLEPNGSNGQPHCTCGLDDDVPLAIHRTSCPMYFPF